MTPPHLVVTDLDGTLLDSASRLGGANRRALEALGHNGRCARWPRAVRSTPRAP